MSVTHGGFPLVILSCRTLGWCPYQELYPGLTERFFGAVDRVHEEDEKRFRSPGGSCTITSGHWYLVTGENFVAEGSLGETSSRVERPNTGVCP